MSPLASKTFPSKTLEKEYSTRWRYWAREN